MDTTESKDTTESMDTRDPEQAEELKKKGNAAMQKGELDEAIKFYTEAIQLHPDNHVLFSNRCAAFLKQKKFNEAYEDATSTVRIKPDWAKGYSRLGAALLQLDRLREAEDAYNHGLRLDPSNQDMQVSRDRIRKKQADIPNPFSDPTVLQRLSLNEKTRGYMADPKFKEILADLGKKPDNLVKYMQDHRVMDALGVLLNVDLINAAGAPPDPFLAKPGTGPDASAFTGEEPEDRKNGSSHAAAEEPKDGTDKEQALAEKEKGNAAYKQKDFATALAHYDRAAELDPTNITFLTNKAAVYFEQAEWDLCIQTCDQAVKLGREHRVDFKVIAKALARIGNVYFKKGEWEDAIKFYNHSLAEHRNQDIVKKKNEAQKTMKEAQRLAYVDPDLAVKEKQAGNDYFKKGDYPNAMKHYNEAIKRNPDDAKLYSNRALCYQKLLEFPLALKDCEECIRLDPNFVKGYIRKGHALLGIRDTVKAMSAFQHALDLDPNNADAKNGVQRCLVQDDPEARRNAALHDPEVQEILRDPAMQLVLQQMQKQPEAVREHLRDPEIAAKIQILLESGFISLR